MLLIFFKAPAENNEIPIASTVSAAGPVEFEGTPILESPDRDNLESPSETAGNHCA